MNRDVRHNLARPRRHHQHPVGHRHRLVDAVRDEHGRARPLGLGRRHRPEMEQLVAHLLAGDLVQRRERLVHQQQRRIERQRAGNRDPLLHPARQRVGPKMAKLAEPHQLDQLGDRRSVPGARRIEFAPQADVGLDIAPGQQGRLLEDQPDLLETLRFRRLVAEDRDPPRRRRLQPGDDSQQRGFAAAARSHQRDELARGNRKRGGRDCRQGRAVGARVGQRDAPQVHCVAAQHHRAAPDPALISCARRRLHLPNAAGHRLPAYAQPRTGAPIDHHRLHRRNRPRRPRTGHAPRPRRRPRADRLAPPRARRRRRPANPRRPRRRRARGRRRRRRQPRCRPRG